MLLLDKIQKKNYNIKAYGLLRRREQPKISSKESRGR